MRYQNAHPFTREVTLTGFDLVYRFVTKASTRRRPVLLSTNVRREIGRHATRKRGSELTL
jgi:hypothetical protein